MGWRLERCSRPAGYAPASNSNWTDLAVGNFCGGSEKELVLMKNQHSNFSVLCGPAPYAVGAFDLVSNSSHPWRALPPETSTAMLTMKSLRSGR
jgi:hypothetical protein